MLQTLARQQRAQLHKLLAPALAAQRHTATAMPVPSVLSCAAPSRHFAAAAPAPKSKGKKGAADAAAAAAAAERDSNTLSIEDEYNMIPPIPKPAAAELESLCLTEEQLRFAKRPMPDVAHRRALLPSIYVPEGKKISDHTEADVGKYYEVPESMQRSIPPQLQRSMAQEFMGGGGYQMVRQPGLQIVDGLKQIHAGNKLSKRVFAVRGSSGTGKSASLHYAAQYIREQNAATPEKPWLLVATRGQEFSTEKRGFISPSTVRPGVYDQALYTMDYFGAMLKSESAALKLITLKRKDKLSDVAWPEGKVGTTLYDLVELASTDREQAPRLLYDFVAELRLSTEVPVCVVIDNLNVWDQVCEFIEPFTYNKLDPRKLALVDAFSYFQREAPVRTNNTHAHAAFLLLSALPCPLSFLFFLFFLRDE